ncbi:short chain dehydrogenase reductase [Thozetella sp. PMI_491]|nr:short chain dehydrogenase reductase [Thozetella sp. PMI_491]
MTADTLSLAGKTALITGSGRENGLGAAVARAFARNGAFVAIHHVSDSSKSRAEAVAASISKEFGVKTTVVRGAVEEYGVAERVVRQALEGLGVTHLDILVNNAGVSSSSTLLDATPDVLLSEFGVNAFGPIYFTQAAVRVGKMPRGGRIINVGSCVSKMGPASSGAYAAAKAAQDSLTASLAGEASSPRSFSSAHGITVNTLSAGPFPVTDMARPYMSPDDGSTAMRDGMLAMTRADARLGAVEDFADAALLLVSEKSRWITAQFISVSGGINGTM